VCDAVLCTRPRVTHCAGEVFAERNPEMVAASVIVSVIALGKPETGRESAKADEGMLRREIASVARFTRKMSSLLGFLEDSRKNPCLPANERSIDEFPSTTLRDNELRVLEARDGGKARPDLRSRRACRVFQHSAAIAG